jgi:hypothetical protein
MALQEASDRAARALEVARALVITAGAGMALQWDAGAT